MIRTWKAHKGQRRPSGPVLWNRQSEQSRGLKAWWPFLHPNPNREVVGGKNTDIAHFYTLVAQTHPILGNVMASGSSFQVSTVGTDVSNFDATGPYTATTWYMPTGGNNLGIFSRWNASVGWMLYQPSIDSVVRAYLAGTNISSITAISDRSRAYHLAATYDGTLLRLYIDGIEEINSTAAASSSGGGLVCFGNYANNSIGGQGVCVADCCWYPGVCKTPQQIWSMFDPETRWEKYLVPATRTYFDVVAVTSLGFPFSQPQPMPAALLTR